MLMLTKIPQKRAPRKMKEWMLNLVSGVQSLGRAMRAEISFAVLDNEQKNMKKFGKYSKHKIKLRMTGVVWNKNI